MPCGSHILPGPKLVAAHVQLSGPVNDAEKIVHIAAFLHQLLLGSKLGVGKERQELALGGCRRRVPNVENEGDSCAARHQMKKVKIGEISGYIYIYRGYIAGATAPPPICHLLLQSSSFQLSCRKLSSQTMTFPLSSSTLSTPPTRSLALEPQVRGRKQRSFLLVGPLCATMWDLGDRQEKKE